MRYDQNFKSELSVFIIIVVVPDSALRWWTLAVHVVEAVEAVEVVEEVEVIVRLLVEELEVREVQVQVLVQARGPGQDREVSWTSWVCVRC